MRICIIVMTMRDVCSYYLYLYSHWLPQPLRDLVSQVDNCDAILVNFLVSHVTRKPPIGVVRRPLPSAGHGGVELSSETLSFHTRQYCIGRFTKQFGYMPLIRSSVKFEPLLHRDSVSVLRKKYRQMENSGV